MKHKRVYEMLKAIGHSPFWAMAIIIDARRGDCHALTWIKAARNLTRKSS